MVRLSFSIMSLLGGWWASHGQYFSPVNIQVCTMHAYGSCHLETSCQLCPYRSNNHMQGSHSCRKEKERETNTLASGELSNSIKVSWQEGEYKRAVLTIIPRPAWYWTPNQSLLVGHHKLLKVVQVLRWFCIQDLLPLVPHVQFTDSYG